MQDLAALLGRFLAPIARRMPERLLPPSALSSLAALPADAALGAATWNRPRRAIGSASARIMVASVVEEETLRLDEVLRIVDEASQALAHSRELEQKSRELEHATAELREANQRLQELDRLKDDFVSTVSHELRTRSPRSARFPRS